MTQYQQQQSLLSAEARAEKEQAIMQLQQQAQQAAYTAEMEFQQEYAKKMEELINKMRAVTVAIGAEKKYELIFEATESGLIYKDSGVEDITSIVITKYNAKHP